MCRNIKKLRRPAGTPTEEELSNAALQFVRKISGYPKPSQQNAAVFEQAVADIARTAQTLFTQLA